MRLFLSKVLSTNNADLEFGTIFLKDSSIMEHIKLFCSVFTGDVDNDFFATGMLVEESGDVVYFSVDDDPTVGIGVVFGDLFNAV